MDTYTDIMNVAHKISSGRAKMSIYNRAAQFAPFAALNGHDEAIDETARLTDSFYEISEDSALKLSQKLYILLDNICFRPEISVTYFVPDKKKSGGAFKTKFSAVKNIDTAAGIMAFSDRTEISLFDITEIRGEIFGEYFE